MLSRLPDTTIRFVATKSGWYGDSKGLKLHAEHELENFKHPDIVIIPGGFGIDAILDNADIIRWIQNAHQTSTWTVSVCSGSLLLAAAGILKDCSATTHWLRKDQLRRYGVNVMDERYVKDGNILTSAGVSAGIDMALYLTSLIVNENYAKAIQLSME